MPNNDQAVVNRTGSGSSVGSVGNSTTTKLGKRIPSSFCSSVIKDGEYVIANSGARLYNVRLPASESVTSATVAAAADPNQTKPSTTTLGQKRNNNASAYQNAKTLLGLIGSKISTNNPNPVNSQNRVVRPIRSDEPTVLVDAIADFSKKFNPKNVTATTTNTGNSNNPNHAHHHHTNNNQTTTTTTTTTTNNNSNNKLNQSNSKYRLTATKTTSKTSMRAGAAGAVGGSKSNQKLKLTKIPSDAPTAMIAPDDYEHIYKASPPSDKGPKTIRKKGQVNKAAVAIASDAPTALIAPDDYEHIYSIDQKQTAQQAGATGAAAKPVPKNVTNDIQHQIQQQQQQQQTTVAPPKTKVTGTSEARSVPQRKTQTNLISTANTNTEGVAITAPIANSFNRKNPGGSSSTRLNTNVTKNDAVGALNRRVAGTNPNSSFSSNSRVTQSNKVEMMSGSATSSTAAGGGGGNGGSTLQMNDKSTHNLTLPPTGAETGCCLLM